MKLMKQNPTFTVETKVIKEATGKKTYEGLNKAFIEKYISIQTNAADLKAQYEQAAKMGKFPLVRKWFLNTFKNFDMAAAKEEIEQAIFAEIAAATEKKPAVLTMAEMKSAS
jgi:phosphoribosylformylglycinamidine (FGAM) synthase PurS component